MRSLHGGLHSKIVSPRGVSSTSTRISSRYSGGVFLCAHFRTRFASSSGIMTSLGVEPRSV
jgi:hypothetical protein